MPTQTYQLSDRTVAYEKEIRYQSTSSNTDVNKRTNQERANCSTHTNQNSSRTNYATTSSILLTSNLLNQINSRSNSHREHITKQILIPKKVEICNLSQQNIALPNFKRVVVDLETKNASHYNYLTQSYGQQDYSSKNIYAGGGYNQGHSQQVQQINISDSQSLSGRVQSQRDNCGNKHGFIAVSDKQGSRLQMDGAVQSKVVCGCDRGDFVVQNRLERFEDYLTSIMRILEGDGCKVNQDQLTNQEDLTPTPERLKIVTLESKIHQLKIQM